MSGTGAVRPRFDLIVHGGTVFDGSGRPGFQADVGVRDGRIAAVADLSDATATETLDASGLCVLPGFIDIHSHSDYTLLVDGRASSQVSQGVTTELIGNCGHGCAPIGSDPAAHIPNIYGYTGDVEISWRSTAGFLEALEAAAPAVNVATLVPNGNLRIATLENAEQAAGPEEVAHMKELLAEGMEAGAFGLSLGLEYSIESAASHAELSELARATADRGGMLAVHTANKDAQATESIAAAVQLARDADADLQVSHIVPRRGAPGGALEQIVDMLESEATGGRTAYDVHTRLHGITNLSAALPAQLATAPPDEIRAALADPAVREAVKSHPGVIQSFALGGWDRVILRSSEALPGLAGRSFSDITNELRTDPWHAVFHVLSESADNISEPMCMCHSYEERDVVTTAAQDDCLIGSDATALCLDGPLAGREFHGAYTWAGWAFSRLAAAPIRMPVETIARKMSAMPAEKLGLSDRGYIREGFVADISVLSATDFRETGTLEEPNSLCTGVAHVIVNGEIAQRGGQLTASRSGKILRRNG